MAEKGYSLKNIAREINSRLKAVLPTGLYFCACMVEWNYTHHIARVLNFGLPVVMVVNSSGVVKNHIHSQHPPLGILPEIDREFHYVEVNLEHDDCIYLFTDGVIETQNIAGEQFGLERLEQLLTQFQVPEQRFDYICRSINEFRGDTPQSDDMAIAEIKCDTTLNDHSLEGKESVSYYLPAILNLSFTLHPDAMRTNNFIEDLTDLLIGTHIAVRKQKQNIFLILSELYTNALEHGILQMDTTLKNEPIGFEKYFSTRGEKLAALSTGWIKIDMELFVQNTNGRVVLHIEDSGRGFDYQSVQKTQPDLNALRGRGVYLVRSLCKEVAIEGAGNKVTAIFEW
jgi:anti-sigma regulatory factor (Ser/Thr protein kinase)